MRHAGRLLVALGLVAMSLGAIGTHISLATERATFADEFDHAGYGGNDGTERWLGPWKETPTNNGSSKGRITVETRLTACPGGCLSIGEPDPALDLAIERSADTEGADEATLRIEYLIDGAAGVDAGVRLDVSDGGSGWETLRVFPLSESQTGMTVAEFDVTGHIGTETTIRFSIDGEVSTSAALLVDALSLTAEYHDETGPTTTTSPATTTSTTTTSTTTTSTTTTTTSPTTTTTSPTTTTTSPTTTTTRPASTTTTLESGDAGRATTTTSSIPRPTDDPGFATDKGMLVSSSETAAEAVMRPMEDRATPNEPEPLHVVTFVNAAESVRSTAVYGVGIGVLLAGFLLLGFDVPEGERRDPTEKGGAPRNLRRSFDP